MDGQALRSGGVSERYGDHPRDELTDAERAQMDAEWLTYENARRARIDAAQDREDLILKTARWFEVGAYWDRRAKGDGSHELSFQETYGKEPLWP